MPALAVTPLAFADHPEWLALVAAMAAHPGDQTVLLVAAGWAEEHDRPDLAANLRDRAPALSRRHRAAAACLDALLAVDVSRLSPVPLLSPARRGWRSNAAWVEITRDALRPLRVPGLTVAMCGYGGGAAVEVRVPPAGFAVPDGRDGWFPLPWTPSHIEMAQAARQAIDAIMPALFPGEPPRVVHADGDTWQTTFWRVAPRAR